MTREDTVFIYYLNIIDSGMFINGYADLVSDFAGYFLLKDFENDNIKLEIKNYRDPETVYDLSLVFDNKSLSWDIENSLISYLPRQALLELCE